MIAALMLLVAPLALGPRPAGSELDAGDRPPATAAVGRAPWPEAEPIGQIHIHVGNVFDPSLPEEDRWLFRLANRLHRTTREQVVRRQLLLRPGEPLSLQRVAESERLLRQNRYLYEPQVRVVRGADGAADVEVETHDVWTLSLGAAFGRSGGRDHSSAEINDTNFLGLGKEVLLRRSFDADRDTWLLRYVDPQWRGGRSRVLVALEDRSDGELWDLRVEHPFLSLDDRWAAGFEASAETRIDSRYRRGEVVDRFDHQRRFLELSRGLSRGFVNGRTHRLSAGFTYSEDRFGLAAIEPAAGDIAAELDLPSPRDRTLSILWLGYQSLQDAFAETRNLDRIERTEDRYLGPWLNARAGVSLVALDASHDQVVFDLALGTGREIGSRGVLETSGYLRGRFGSSSGGERFEDLRFGADGRFYWRSAGGRRVFFVHGAADAVRNPDPETQLLLGGDSGLRGYPLRYQDGDRRLLLTLEERFFTPWTLFALADVGAAVFADLGRAWRPGDADDPGAGWLADVGIGLRLGLKRSGRANVLHFDLAMPLGGPQGLDGLQWLVGTRQTF